MALRMVGMRCEPTCACGGEVSCLHSGPWLERGFLTSLWEEEDGELWFYVLPTHRWTGEGRCPCGNAGALCLASSELLRMSWWICLRYKPSSAESLGVLSPVSPQPRRPAWAFCVSSVDPAARRWCRDVFRTVGEECGGHTVAAGPEGSSVLTSVFWSLSGPPLDSGS